MEEYRNTVIKLHAIYSMIISKFTGNISKDTSKFTSKTNQIRLGGGAIRAWGSQGWTTCLHVPRGLAPGLPTSSRACTCWRKGPMPMGGWPQGPMAPFGERLGKRKKTATPLRLSPILPTFLGLILRVLSDDLAYYVDFY